VRKRKTELYKEMRVHLYIEREKEKEEDEGHPERIARILRYT